MPSKLVYYNRQNIRTQILEGVFRGITWSEQDESLVLVGNGGQIIRVQDGQISSINSNTRHNLRAVAIDAVSDAILVVGNTGTALLIDDNEKVTKVPVPLFENLRAVAWHRKKSVALIAGNNGTLFEFSSGRMSTVNAGRANLRDISWRPENESALIASNCFAGEFIPSPNLFHYDSETKVASPVNGGRVDLIGVDWKPTGESALVAGYDVVWHNGFIGYWDGTSVAPIEFENKNTYPVAVRWNPMADTAAVVTATSQPGVGMGCVLVWDGKVLEPIFSDPEFFFSDATWIRNGETLAALAATETRAFNS
jgi:hypothetical protein